MWEYRRHIVRKAGPENWVVRADSDEFHHIHISDISRMESKGYHSAFGLLIDRLPSTYLQTGVSNAKATLACPFSRNIASHSSLRVVAHKGYLMTNRGSGRIIGGPPFAKCKEDDNRVYDVLYASHHMKWRTSTVAKLRRRISTYKRLGFGWWKESAKFLDAMSNANSSSVLAKCTNHLKVPKLVGTIPMCGKEYEEWLRCSLDFRRQPMVSCENSPS